jgi:hypothetical protein
LARSLRCGAKCSASAWMSEYEKARVMRACVGYVAQALPAQSRRPYVLRRIAAMRPLHLILRFARMSELQDAPKSDKTEVGIAKGLCHKSSFDLDKFVACDSAIMIYSILSAKQRLGPIRA